MNTPPRPLLALMAAMDLPAGADVPDWVHLLPADNTIRTFDGRGPYRVVDAAAVIAASMSDERGMLIDENHSTDKIGQQGGEAPARGWIKELQARADGIWGRVDWNASGRALLADRAYRGISPVFFHTKAGEVLQILRASLTNVPNIKNLTALNMAQKTAQKMESPVTLEEFLARLAEKLGLPATATAEEVMAAIPAKSDMKPAAAMQSALAAIGTELGVDDANPTAILAAVKGKLAQGAAQISLQAENATLRGRLDALEMAQKRAASEAFIDGEIANKRAIRPEDREFYITFHMEDPSRAQRAVAGLMTLATSHMASAPPDTDAVITALNAEQKAVADQLGQPHDKFLAALQADAKKEAN